MFRPNLYSQVSQSHESHESQVGNDFDGYVLPRHLGDGAGARHPGAGAGATHLGAGAGAGATHPGAGAGGRQLESVINSLFLTETIRYTTIKTAGITNIPPLIVGPRIEQINKNNPVKIIPSME